MNTRARMDYDYDHDEQYGGRILWGRVAVLGVALLLMFALGRCTAAGGVPEAELEAAQAQAAELAAENESLRQEVAALTAGQTPAVEGEGEGEGEGEAAPVRTYVVRPGDTLFSIAQEVYGNGQKFDLIAQANGIDQNNKLRVGQELVIPPAE